MGNRKIVIHRTAEHWFGLILLSAVIVVPVGWIMLYSAAYSFGGIGRLSAGWTLRYWMNGLQSGSLASSLLLSMAVSASIVSFALITSLGFVLVSADLRDDRRLFALLLLPLGTPVAVAAVVVYQILNPGGLLARIAFHGRWINSPSDFPVFVNDVWSLGIIAAGTFTAFPLLTLFFFKTWSAAKIDKYCRLAESLGATTFRSRIRVALPMLLRRSRSMILLMFLVNLGSYEIPLLLGRQSPQMISVLTQRRFGRFDLLHRPQAFVFATAYLVVVAAGVVTLQLGRRHRG